MRRFYCSFFVIVLVLVAACSPGPSSTIGEGPRLVRDVALGTTEATESPPTRIISPTPVRTVTLQPLEVISPPEQVTVDADFILVTPTLPPSKTPTATPTISLTPTQTPTPTVTVTATTTFQAFPTSVISPIVAPVAEPRPVICDSQWFFLQPRPAGCPLAPPSAAQGVYQTFQNGHMIWVGQLDAIYVLYNDPALPRWEVWHDEFEEGDMEYDPSWSAAPTNTLWQPRRGFGQLWRREQAVRDRVGWATLEWEVPYSAQVQNEDTGTIFMSDPDGRIFALMPGQASWQLYSGSDAVGETRVDTSGNDWPSGFGVPVPPSPP